MKLYSQTLQRVEVEAIARRLQLRLAECDPEFHGRTRDSRRLEFKIRPLGDLHRKRNRHGRRVCAVDGEGHFLFVEALFREDSHARLTSVMARFDGQTDFAARGESFRSMTFAEMGKGRIALAA